MSKSKNFELEYILKKKESIDAYSFYFKWPEKDFNFIPGQYLKIFLDLDNVDERGSSRYFTISSSPKEKEFIVITTRIIKSSFKKSFLKLKPGEVVKAFGPIGYFDFEPKNKLKNIFLAAGIGVTPFHSIIQTLKYSKHPNIYLFAFFPKIKDLIFYDEFKKNERKYSNLKIIYSLTKEEESNFENGRLSEELLKRHIEDYRNANYFITGSNDSVDSMFNLVRGMGIPEENIFKEDFPGY
jgi:NADH oxidoreductase Hcr